MATMLGRKYRFTDGIEIEVRADGTPELIKMGSKSDPVLADLFEHVAAALAEVRDAEGAVWCELHGYTAREQARAAKWGCAACAMVGAVKP